MKKLFILLVTVLVTLTSYSQTKLYVHPDGENYAANTETLAVLPLKVQVKLRPKQLKDFTQDQIEEMQRNEALDIQKLCILGFLQEKKR